MRAGVVAMLPKNDLTMLLRGINDMLEREPKKKRGRPLLNSKNTALSPLDKRIPRCLFL